MVTTSNAQNIGFSYIKYENQNILTTLSVLDSLPSALIDHIEKGVPIAFEYDIELWQYKSGWFDKLSDKLKVAIKLRFDPWEKKYSMIIQSRDLDFDNSLDDWRAVWDLLKSSGKSFLEIGDTTATYYLNGKLSIKTMSFSNYREVESWLKGEISSAQKPDLDKAPNQLGEFIFETALKITGLKNKTSEIKSEKFKISALPMNKISK